MKLDKYTGHDWVNGGRSLETGVDCWGLVVEFYRIEFGVELPLYKNVNYDDNTKSVDELARQENMRDKFYKVEDKQFGDVVVFNVRGYPIHVGIVANRNQFLHSCQNQKSSLARFNSPRWKNKIDGFYRYSS